MTKNEVIAMKEELKFEKAIEKLESVVSDLEGGEIPLEEAIKKYEDGVKLSRLCLEKLNQAERKVEILTKTLSGEIAKEDFVLDDIREEQFRRIPENGEHSAAWCIWHLARIEDITMNLLVAGTNQRFIQDGWQDRLQVSFRDAGNDMTRGELQTLSARIDLTALRAYRVAVGQRTREIVRELHPEDLKQKVDLVRLQRVMAEGALTPAARNIRDYWGKRDIAGLLLMPATRHNILHLNEILKLKKKRSQ